MSLPALTRLSGADGSWARFKDDWRAQCANYGEDFDLYASGAFTVLDDLAANPEPRSGIFALVRNGKFAAVCQANVTPLPGYDGPVLRIRMMLLSPDYDFGEISVDEYAIVLIDMFSGVMELSHTDMPARHVKFHLRSPADRQFFAALGRHLDASPALESVQMRGGWLYVTKNV